MTRAILIAFSAASLCSVACGTSGDGAPIGGGTIGGNQEPAFNSGQPGQNPDQPGLGGQQPPGNSNQPAGSTSDPASTGHVTSGAGQSGFNCSALCGSIDPSCAANCAQWCQLIDPSATLCGAEAAALRGCAQHATLRCEKGKVRPQGDACSSEGSALVDCLDAAIQAARPPTRQQLPGPGSGGSVGIANGTGGAVDVGTGGVPGIPGTGGVPGIPGTGG